MKITAEIRREIKKEQKPQVREYIRRCIGANTILLLPTVLIVVLGNILMSNLGAPPEVQYTADPGMLSIYRMLHFLQRILNVYLLMAVLFLVIVSPLKMGIMQFYITLSRGEKPSLSAITHQFTSVFSIWRAVRMQICLWFRAFLWILLPGAVYVGAVSAAAMTYVSASGGSLNVDDLALLGAIMPLNLAFWLLVLLPLSVRLTFYNAGYAVAYDNEDVGMWISTAAGSSLFKGHFWEMVLFFLSFAPWFLLYAVPALALYLGIFMAGALVLKVLCGVLLTLFVLTAGSALQSYVQACFFALFDRLQMEAESAEPDSVPYSTGSSEQFLQWMRQQAEQAERERKDDSTPADAVPQDKDGESGDAGGEQETQDPTDENNSKKT